MYRCILVPLDGSEFAEHALPAALTIARRAAATLDLVESHAFYTFQDSANWQAASPAMDDVIKEQERGYLRKVAGRLHAAAPVNVTAAVATGLAVDAILDRASTIGAQLIVTTTHGRGPLSRLLLGSIADELVRQSSVPLLLIRPREPAVDLAHEPKFERISIALDGSPLAEQVLEPALELGRLFGASYLLFRHLDEQAADNVRAEAERQLEIVAGKLREQGVEVRTELAVGSKAAAVAILEHAEKDRCDSIALATHGRGGLSRLLLGSVASSVVRQSSVPVLLYRPRVGERREP